MMQMKKALVSVYDKREITALCQTLIENDYVVFASGGTLKCLRESSVQWGNRLQSITALASDGLPDSLVGGRVKTLRAGIHAGILAKTDDVAELARYNLSKIDAVICNVYPFESCADDMADSDRVEFIDIGGPAMLRAAAKNYARVTVCCCPDQYEMVSEIVRSAADESTLLQKRKALAAHVFRLTSHYDAAIAERLSTKGTLRYGENPHQTAHYVHSKQFDENVAVLRAEKQISYNNWLDIDVAYGAAMDITTTTGCATCVVIVKHGSPCGAACCPSHNGADVRAFSHALACDPVSAFGSVIGVSCKVTSELIQAIIDEKLFVECIVALKFEKAALSLLAHKKKNCRVVQCVAPAQSTVKRTLPRLGMTLVQEPDITEDVTTWTFAGTPTRVTRDNCAHVDVACFAWVVAKFCLSNAIVFAARAGDVYTTVGIGCGQPNRIDCVKMGAHRMRKVFQDYGSPDDYDGVVMASDAFFPFDDCVVEAHASSVALIVQPGGSIRDKEVNSTAQKCGISMIHTHTRHFRH